MSAGLERSRSGLTRINVHYAAVDGTDAVVDTFAVGLNQGLAGTPTDTLTALLRRAEPITLLDATVDVIGHPPRHLPERRQPPPSSRANTTGSRRPRHLNDPESPR